MQHLTENIIPTRVLEASSRFTVIISKLWQQVTLQKKALFIMYSIRGRVVSPTPYVDFSPKFALVLLFENGFSPTLRKLH